PRLRPSLLPNSNRNPKASNAAASAVREDKVVSAVLDGAATALPPALSNRETEEKQGSEVSTRATSSDSPRARIRRERGKKKFENDTVGRLGKRSGTYTALQNKSEVEFGVTDNVLVEFGLFGSYHRIQDVPDFDDRNGARFDGAFAEVKYRFLDRDVHGFGMAFSVEPEWHRYSELTGRFENSYAVEFKLYADKELIPGRLFIAGNLVYEPEAVLAKEFDPDTGQFTKWERESTFQALGAISGAVTPDLFLGAEVRYLAHYEGSFLNHLQGRALYVGPTLYARLSSKSTITLAYSWQVAGKAMEEPDQKLDLLN